MIEDATADVVDFHQWFSAKDVIAVDTETTGTDYMRDTIRLVQFGDSNRAYVFPVENNPMLQAVVSDALLCGKIWVMHNRMFDETFLRAAGMPVVGSIECTMTLSHLHDSSVSKGLKELAKRYEPGMIAGQRDLNKVMKENKWNWATIPIDTPEYWVYAGIDACLTHRIWRVLRYEVPEDLFQTEMKSQSLLSRMQLRGFRINELYFSKLLVECQDYVVGLEEWAQDEYGVMLGSEKAVVQKLLDEGCNLTVRTPQGTRYSLSEAALCNIDHPLTGAYLNRKTYMKMASTYLKHFVQDNYAGRIHAWVHPLGARTGRMSMSKPNLQNVPKTEAIRTGFIPEEGHKLVCVDFRMAELCVMAHYCQDVALIEACNSEDVHTEIAKRVWGKESVTQEERAAGKNVTFALLYGAGPNKIARMTGLPLKEARRLLNHYYRVFPRFRGYMKKLVSEAATNDMGQLITYAYTGRKQIASDTESYKLVNYIVQGTTADILKVALARIENTVYGDRAIIPVHDEIIFSVPEQDANDFAREVVDVMSYRERDPHVIAEASVYDHWGQSCS